MTRLRPDKNHRDYAGQAEGRGRMTEGREQKVEGNIGC